MERRHGKRPMDGTLTPFYYCEEFVSALQEFVEEGVVNVLPALQNVFLEGTLSSSPVPGTIGNLVATRERL